MRSDGRQALLSDAAWSFLAFGALGAAGVALNLGIALRSGEAALGVFNQVSAVWFVGAQLATFGLHDAAQKHVAEHPDDPARQEAAGRSALRLVLGSGALVAVVFFLLAGPLGRLADSAEVARGLALAMPGLALFAPNKVLLGILTGQRRLRAFALAQVARVVVLLAVVLGMLAAERPSAELALAFPVAEIAILPALLAAVRPWRPLSAPGVDARVALAFGARALPNGLLTEGFRRVDVLVLGAFVADGAVGIYSFAAMFAEGLYQVGVTVRNAVNPRLVPLLARPPSPELAALARRAMGLGFGAFALVAGVVAGGFPLLAAVFDPALVAASHAVLLVLVAGLAVYAAFVPLDFALLQAGMPGRQSAWMALNVALALVLDLLLVPPLGVRGAAIATASAWALSALTLNVAAWWWLGLRGGFLFRA